jgi:type IV pilus assembly protein PilW
MERGDFMEMKRKEKHISLRCSNQGFTIVELMVAMVVSLLAMGAIYSTFLAQHRSYQVQGEAAEMQQNIRVAMYYMQREIRMAGSDPFNEGGFGITAANQTSITFTEDVRSGIPPVVGPPDGFVNVNDVPNEDITYTLNGTDLVRTDNNANLGVGDTQVVAQNIDWLDFVYLDEEGEIAATLGDIRSVEITIVARTDDPLLYGTTNNTVYWNQRQSLPGEASWTAPGDNVSRRTLTTQIYCRNLDL